MSKITFLPDNITIDAENGNTILEVALDNNIDIPHNCGGACACSTCHVIIRSGFDILEEMDDKEAFQLDEAEGLQLTSRLACQVKINGDLVVDIPQINKSLRNLFHEGKNKE